MGDKSVTAEHRERVTAHAAALADIGALQVHGQHTLVAGCIAAVARTRVADHVDGTRGVDEVAAAAGVDPQALRRIVRFLDGSAMLAVACVPLVDLSGAATVADVGRLQQFLPVFLKRVHFLRGERVSATAGELAEHGSGSCHVPLPSRLSYAPPSRRPAMGTLQRMAACL